ncbi:MAG: lipoprotein signal peptidase [Saprospiraceae bacterium]
MKQGYKVSLLVLVVLLIDQAVKFYVKTHFEYNEDVQMMGADWARLHFVENEGMAFGIVFDWAYGKLILSLFRILMVFGLVWYIRLLMQAKAPVGFVYSIGLITAGALGNIIDSAFYGLIFTESPYHGGLAELTAFGQGYGTFLHGKVVDMLYFPIKYIVLPDWLGGSDFLFFSPIFNVADASITVGVLCILLFQRRFFREGLGQEPDTPAAAMQDLSDVEGMGEPSPSEALPAEPMEYEKPTDTEPAIVSEIPSESMEDQDNNRV